MFTYNRNVNTTTMFVYNYYAQARNNVVNVSETQIIFPLNVEKVNQLIKDSEFYEMNSENLVIYNETDKKNKKIENKKIYTIYRSEKFLDNLIAVAYEDRYIGDKVITNDKAYVSLYYLNTVKISLLKSEELKNKFIQFQLPEEKSDDSIGFIVREDGEFNLDFSNNIKGIKNLNLDLYYNDDFKEIHKTIIRELKKKRSGIYILDGLPGTGKTNYLRYLIPKIKNKKVIFVPPHMIDSVSDPQFIQFLTRNLNDCVIILEDAENLIVKEEGERRSSGMVNILNMSDGLLGDCLNIQFIITFNTSRCNIDPALLREGRLIAEYQFEKISPEKSTEISKKIGKNIVYKEPQTLGVIFNEKVSNVSDKKHTKIGF